MLFACAFAHPTEISSAISRQIDAAIVPMEGIDADHALAAVEQRPEPTARGLVGKLLHPVADRNGGVAHDIDPLLDLEDLVGARVGGREELDLAAAFARGAALVFEVHLEAFAVGGD